MADTYTTSQTMPSWVQPFAAGYLNQAQNVADQAYQPYTGNTVAGFNPFQTSAFQGVADRAASGGIMGSANQALTGMFNQAPREATKGADPIGVGSNPYAGQNPYLQQQIDATMGDMSRNWNNVAAPSWAKMNSASGSFGNAGLALAENDAFSQSQRNAMNMASGMRFGDYTNQQQLAESALHRGLQASQFNAGLKENFAARNDAMYNNGMNRQLSALGMAPAFANQDYNDLNQLMNVGTMVQGQDQRLLTDNYNRFLESRNYPKEQLDVMKNALGGVNFGQNTTRTEPGTSPLASLAGGALTGASLWNWLFNDKVGP